MIPVDNTSNFGFHRPNTFVRIIICITRSVGSNWLSKRVIFLLRRIAIVLSDECIDTKIFKNCEHRIPSEGSSLGLDFLKKNLY